MRDMKNYLNLVWGGLLGTVGVSCTEATPTKSEKPNFVFIYMDDMGYSDVSCYGETRWTTPNIDALAAEGIKFTDCYAASPISSPSRAGFLTGRYPARMGIQGVFYPDSYTGDGTGGSDYGRSSQSAGVCNCLYWEVAFGKP